MVIVNAFLQEKENKIEIAAFEKLSKINRRFGYYGWNILDFRYGKDIRLYEAKDLMVEKWEGFTDQSIGYWKEKSDKELPLQETAAVFDIGRDIASYLYLGILVLPKCLMQAGFSTEP